MDIGQRLRRARLAQGMTMRRLGGEVGVSAAAISKYESGKNVPRPSVLLKLAKALHVQTEFLVRELTVELGSPAFREDRPLSKRLREAVMARIKDDLEKYQMVESLFGDDRLARFRVDLDRVKSIDDAETAANALRVAWGMGLGPISNLTGRLEDHGVKVFGLGSIPQFDGFSCWLNHSTPVIAYSADIPGDRQRFTMAHELAHLVLDPTEGLDEEKVANRFAGALIAPRTALAAELGCCRSQLSVAELSILKQEYGLSMLSLSRRAFELGIITEHVYVSLRRLFRKQKWSKEEPGGQVPQECPRRYSLLLLQAMTEGLLTPSTAAALAGHHSEKHLEVTGEALQKAVESMVAEYRTNKELIAFTLLNTEDIKADAEQPTTPR